MPTIFIGGMFALTLQKINSKKRRKNLTRTFALLAALVAATSICAFATDGQILINQSTIMNAGGFPYTISQPGSYKLSGNLIVPVATDCFHITAQDVVLDLNGFAITLTVPSPFGNFGAIGILTSGNNLTVRNGTIRGFAFPVSGSSFAWRLDELNLLSGFASASSDIGTLNVPFGSRVSNVTAILQAILVTCPSSVINTVMAAGSLGSFHPAGCTGYGNSPAFP